MCSQPTERIQSTLYPVLASYQEMGPRIDVCLAQGPSTQPAPSAPSDFPLASGGPAAASKPVNNEVWILIRVWRWFTSSDSENFEAKYRESVLKIDELQKQLAATQETIKQLQNVNTGLSATVSENLLAQQGLQTSYQELSNKATFLEGTNYTLRIENSNLQQEKNTLHATLRALTEEKDRVSEMNVTLTAGIQTEKEKILSGKVRAISDENEKLKARVTQLEKLFRDTKTEEAKLRLDFNDLSRSMVDLQDSKKDTEMALAKERDANARLLRTIPQIAIHNASA